MTNKWILTAAALLLSPGVYAQDTEIKPEIREPIAVVPEPVYGSETNPVILYTDSIPIIIDSANFVFTPPYRVKSTGAWLDFLPDLFARRYPITFNDFYTIGKKRLAENFFVLHVSLYQHDKNARIIYKNIHTEIITKRLWYMEQYLIYIQKADGSYMVFFIPDSPAYNLINGNHADTFGDSIWWADQAFALNLLNCYLKANDLSHIATNTYRMSKKSIRGIKKRFLLKN